MNRTVVASAVDNTPTICIVAGGLRMKMDIFFPIPNSARGNKTISHPYFTLTPSIPDTKVTTQFEWQIHPLRDGILRYTLVQNDENLGSSICAIYHHMGWDLSLSLGYSEGVLLLPEAAKPIELEGIVVASLIGILKQLRMLTTDKKRARKPGQVGRIFRRAMTALGHV
jgi:hypothetical protein